MTKYNYINLPLTPAIAEPLIIEILQRESIASRSVIITETIKFHLERGGVQSKSNLTGTIKKALSNLSLKGKIQSPTIGYWRLSSDLGVTNYKISLKQFQQEEVKDKLNIINSDKRSWIYVYYFPTYKKLAELEGRITWPCKIGRTKNIPLERIKSQVNTAFPELPHIEGTYETQDSDSLEGIIHRILRTKNRKTLNGSGNEWFNTNPEEVKTIIKSIKNINIQ